MYFYVFFFGTFAEFLEASRMARLVRSKNPNTDSSSQDIPQRLSVYGHQRVRLRSVVA